MLIFKLQKNPNSPQDATFNQYFCFNVILHVLIWCKELLIFLSPLQCLPHQDHCGNMMWPCCNPALEGERWCHCSLVRAGWEPAGGPTGPETAPCCWGWRMTGETPSPPTGSSGAGWELCRCSSSWSAGSPDCHPTESPGRKK